MNIEVILAFAAAALLFHTAILILQWLRSPLRSIPGPLLAHFTDVWYFLRLKQGSFEKVNLSLHEKYGPIVRYGPNRYSINDAEASKMIYGHGTQFPKSVWYSAFQPNEKMWNIFSDQSIKRHAYNRRLYTHAFSMTSLVSYEPYLDECGEIFSQRLLEFSKSGAPVDLGHWFQCFAFDAIAYVTYGKRFGFLDCGVDIGEVIKNLDNTIAYSTLAGIYPSFHRYIAPLLMSITSITGSNRIMYIMDFTQDRIMEERAFPKSVINCNNETGGAEVNETFLTKFLAKHSDGPDTFTNYHVLVGCATNMSAGSDTTGISLSAIFYYLLKDPDCLEKLRAEVREFENRGELSRNPTFKEGQNMPYLQAVIKEALRIHPAVGLPLERVIPKGGATMAGRFFPEGSVVGINSWVQHRNKALYGEDAEQFRPERWLINDEERLAAMNRNWMPFGMGSRTCLGKNVSILEMTKLVPRLVRDFEFKLEGNVSQVGSSWKTENAWFVKPRNFCVKMQPRKINN
ncbi:cytochrome p450 pisatin [Colletotrichum truncatum]|uniref:Cytochrome p450 pisatin n=1 Tax=Colletotrichum truncatum TaxID=5467 RepID=A0ACC3YNH3_COLTU|nr:cytochrome p450 pisatin [Colletotrichum truncatum]KAF6789465.1 cytochrome p450 pisatin [Colletotrichum truncatum]